MHGFDAPALRNEFTGEPIEQFGMRRSRATRAEIARSGDETPAEMMLPDAVDQDAGGERIGRTGKPGGKRRSLARGSRPVEARFRLGVGIGDLSSLLGLVALEDCWKARPIRSSVELACCITRVAVAPAAVRTSSELSSVSACGAVTLRPRSGHVTLLSGASNTSKNGNRKLRRANT